MSTWKSLLALFAGCFALRLIGELWRIVRHR